MSVATVSRALQTPQRVSADTRKRVEAAIAELGYVPNMQARSLRTSRSQMVVALVPDISNPFFADVIRGIENVAKDHDYFVLLGETEYDPDREQRYADMITARQVDGMITLLPRMPFKGGPQRPPIVNACEYVLDEDVTSVFVDNRAAVRNATSYALLLGHKKLGFIGGRPDSPISVDRRAGFLDALTAAGLSPPHHLMIDGAFSIEAGIRAAELILSYRQGVTAIVCGSDELAIGALQAVKAAGLRVPQDLSVIGFDDIDFASYTDPPLTTVSQPRKALGRAAMALLMEMLDDPDTPPRKKLLPTHLVIRGSSGPPPAEPVAP